MNFSQRNDKLTIDLGTSNTLISSNGQLLLNEPTIIAIDKRTNKTVAVGNKAFEMHEKTHHNLKTIKPLKDGVVADYTSTQRMLEAFLQKITKTFSFLSSKKIVVCVPFNTTEVEKRAVRDAANALGASDVKLVYEPLAACIGIGLDIAKPKGSLVIDLGGGTTEIAAVSLSSVVCNQSLRIGGETFDRDICEHIRRKYNILISEKAAERIKINIGAVSKDFGEKPEPYEVIGRDVATGIPKSLKIDSHEVIEMLDKTFSQIENGIIKTLEKCPPEIAADIYSNGIFVTGGGAKMRGLTSRLEKFTKLPIKIVEKPLLSVSAGLNTCVENTERYSSVFI